MYKFSIKQDGIIVSEGEAEMLKDLLPEINRYIYSYLEEGPIEKVVIKYEE